LAWFAARVPSNTGSPLRAALFIGIDDWPLRFVLSLFAIHSRVHCYAAAADLDALSLLAGCFSSRDSGPDNGGGREGGCAERGLF